jgi:hypothetical protein
MGSAKAVVEKVTSDIEFIEIHKQDATLLVQL